MFFNFKCRCTHDKKKKKTVLQYNRFNGRQHAIDPDQPYFLIFLLFLLWRVHITHGCTIKQGIANNYHRKSIQLIYKWARELNKKRTITQKAIGHINESNNNDLKKNWFECFCCLISGETEKETTLPNEILLINFSNILHWSFTRFNVWFLFVLKCDFPYFYNDFLFFIDYAPENKNKSIGRVQRASVWVFIFVMIFYRQFVGIQQTLGIMDEMIL